MLLPFFRGSGMEIEVGRFSMCRGMSWGTDSPAAEGLSLPLALLLGLVIQGALTPWRPCGP